MLESELSGTCAKVILLGSFSSLRKPWVRKTAVYRYHFVCARDGGLPLVRAVWGGGAGLVLQASRSVR